jgi:apolipoprotein N-acyltransferase
MSPLERHPRTVGSALALVCGAIFALTAPPTNLTGSVLVGLVGLALVAARARSWREGALFGLAFGAGANLVALRFVPEVIVRFTPLPYAVALLAWVLLSLAQGLAWGIGAGLAKRLHLLGIPWFLAFPAGTFVGFFVPALFPWTPAGGLSPWPVVVQAAELVGERGVSFLVAAGCALVAEGVTTKIARRRLVTLGLAGLVGATLLGYGALAMARVERARQLAPKATLALVQPGTEAKTRWDPAAAEIIAGRLHALTRAAESRGVDLVVWPEAAYPYTLPHSARAFPPSYMRRDVLPHDVHGPVIVGLVMAKTSTDQTNSALVARGDRTLSAPYDKRHLLAFGEHVPFAEELPWMKKTFARGTGLVPGEESIALEAGKVRAGVLVCYEDNLPEAGREAMQTRPNVLVNLTNDAWFAGSAEGELHLRLAVLRAIETRRDLARAVNLGPTGLVDASGRVRSRYDAPLPKALDVEVALLDTAPTPYTRFGDVPLALAIAAACAARAFASRRAQGAKGAEIPVS